MKIGSIVIRCADSGDVNQDSGGDVNQHRSVATLASLSSGN
jgi:hypothetical protein